MPKISAIMGLYNTDFEFLKPTVESVLQQSFKDFELIIIDDASTIEYKQFFKSFNDKRIKYHKLEKNSGVGIARNEGIKIAKGKYIAILDSDDIYLPNRFEAQAEFLDKNPEISIVSCALKYSNTGKIPPVVEHDEDIKIAMLFNSVFAGPAVMFRKDVFLEKNLLYSDIRFAEDYELWIRAMFAGIKMANLKDVLMIYTRRKNQMSKAKKEFQLAYIKGFYKKIFGYLNMPFSLSELDLHYNIYERNIPASDIMLVSDWFDKIIEYNKTVQLFNGEKLIEFKNKTIEDIRRMNDRIFRIKIGNSNFCIYKPFVFAIEKRK